ncbi:DUF2130 domain-containing protein [Paraburkholderia sp. BR10954]|uniref:DUF2130 domain-containing protein n=1 Tax=Paraburkholderia sp. BR10954 TaxID=3236995 RepID=UPI0034D334F4
MNTMEINCPHCGEAFELTEALAAPLLQAERQKVDAEVKRRLQAEVTAAASKARMAAEADAAVKIRAAESIADESAKKLREAQAQELAIRQERERLVQERAAIELTVQRRVDEEAARASKAARAAAEHDWKARMAAAEQDLEAKDAKLRQAEQAEIHARQLQQRAEEAVRQADLTIARRVEAEKERITLETRSEVERSWQAKLQSVEETLAMKDAKLREAEKAEIQARQLKQQADEALRQAELTVSRRLDEERAKVREAAMHERDDEHRLKLSEKDKQLEDMRQQIEELRRKGDRAAQQLVGDVLEIDLQDVLSRAFPHDHFERVKKGQSGADLLQTVRTPSGQPCGRILWESKRTKNWSDAWLGKLREDQRSVKTDLAALITETLPDGVQNFEVIDGVWVSSIATMAPMASALRHGLIETARARVAAEGAGTKKDLVYGYLTGAEFRQRVRGMVEPIVEMRESLMREKAMLTRQWSTREKQLERAMTNVAHMYGDMHGIVGNSLPAVEGLSFLALDTPSETAAMPSGTAEQLGFTADQTD